MSGTSREYYKKMSKDRILTFNLHSALLGLVPTAHCITTHTSVSVQFLWSPYRRIESVLHYPDIVRSRFYIYVIHCPETVSIFMVPQPNNRESVRQYGRTRICREQCPRGVCWSLSCAVLLRPKSCCSLCLLDKMQWFIDLWRCKGGFLCDFQTQPCNG